METISENIARLRKQAGVTQEELATAVGVSPQAVSKWECGGLPDVTLIPAIAAFLHVSTDEVFGCAGTGNAASETERDTFTRNICRQLYENSGYSTDDPTRFFDDLREYIMAMHQSIMMEILPDTGNCKTIAEIAFNDAQGTHTSEMHFDEGVSILNLENDMPFAFILKQPGEPAMLEITDETKALFAMLAHEEGAKLLSEIALHSTPDMGYWSIEKLAAHFNISEAYLREKIPFLEKIHMIIPRSFTFDGEVQNLYCIQSRNAVLLVAILALAGMILRRRERYFSYCGNRMRPWVKK